MDITLALLTAPRSRPTVQHTVGSLRAAGFNQHLFIFAEPHSVIPDDDNCTVTINKDRLGLNANNQAARLALINCTEAAWLAIIEDDIECSPELAAELVTVLPTVSDRIGSVCPYTPKAYSIQAPDLFQLEPRRWVEYAPGTNSWSAQFHIMRRQTAIRVARDCAAGLARPGGVGGARFCDYVIDSYLKDCGLTNLYHVPSLVDHVGDDVSTLGHDAIGLNRGYGYRFSSSPKPFRATSSPGGPPCIS